MTLPMFAASLTRRSVLQGAGALTGLLLSVRMSGAIAAEGAQYGADAMPGGVVDNPLVFVAIATDGTVTVTVHRPEMGQGIRTSLAMVIAEQLQADWQHVRVVQAPADEARYGSQNTDGSRSMRHFYLPMSRVGAAARLMLETAAATRWNVPVSEVAARNHEVVHDKTGRVLSFGSLAQEAACVPVPGNAQLTLKPASEFRYVGKGQVHLVDGVDIAHGQAAYSIDTRVPDMLYAVVARPQVSTGKVKSFDASDALKVPGVVKVVEIAATPGPPLFNPLGGVAVIARNTWAAIQGREALRIDWDDGDNAQYNSAQFKKTLQQAARRPAKAVRNQGNALRVLKQKLKRVVAEYYLPHLAHATMEPPNATARIVDGKCEVWTGVQAPQITREMVAQYLELKPEEVTINVTLMGGGFGRKSKPDYVVEAALLSKAMDGQAVKVQWTRTDDLQHDYYHTVSLERFEAALDDKGMPLAWLHRSAEPTIGALFEPGAMQQSPEEFGQTAIGIPYQIPNIRVEIPAVAAHTRIGWFRSVTNIPHAFGVQCFVAELAAAAKRDAKDYLLELIGPKRRIDPGSQHDEWNYGESPQRYPIDTARLRNVIELAAAQAQWAKPLPGGRGRGIAATYSFLTYAAAVFDVAVDAQGKLTIMRVDVALDCGPQVNPERIRAQVEGSVIMGISLAMSGEISFQAGRAMQSNFHDYRVLRMPEAPREIHVHLVPHSFDVALGGVGEPALPPIAPALCNAIYAATGKRIRQLPINQQLASTTGSTRGMTT